MEKSNNNFEKRDIEEEIRKYLVDGDFKISLEKPVYTPEKFHFERNISINGLKKYFEKMDFKISEPIPLKLEQATTLFVSAGIQKLENVIHIEEEFPDTPIFINQPVLRSQFLGSSAVESHTSFHNITTLDIGASVEKHLGYFKKWIEYLIISGFCKEDFLFQIKEDTPKLGNVRYNNFVIKVFYAGLEVGDAVFIPLLPQKTRPDFSISDIGFGLERLSHNPEVINTVEKDCLKTLALLSVSNVQPSNNDHGYRFRMFSKRLVSECKLDYSKLTKILETTSDFIEYWAQSGTDVLIDKDKAIDLVIQECERNFNREMLNFLKKDYGYQNEIDINQTTMNFVNQLEKIGDKSNDFWNSIKTLLTIN